jgi:hypothetical protein
LYHTLGDGVKPFCGTPIGMQASLKFDAGADARLSPANANLI